MSRIGSAFDAKAKNPKPVLQGEIMECESKSNLKLDIGYWLELYRCVLIARFLSDLDVESYNYLAGVLREHILHEFGKFKKLSG